MTIYMNKAPVHCRGEKLGQIWWQGRQWAVTEHGIECQDGSYCITKERLAETLPSPLNNTPDWPLHMAEKTWVDVADFLTAYLVALSLHGCRVEPKFLHRAIELALTEERR
jgi:hypothetical protein